MKSAGLTVETSGRSSARVFESCSVPRRALPVSPASSARSMASLNDTRFTCAQAARRATEVSPMPRLGTLTMRRADTSSSGLARTRT